jgi:hypothetical protein
MATWSKEQGREALAAISSLKRATGIPNHPTKTDTFVDHRFHIYAPDQESAEFIAEFLWRYASGTRTAFYDARPEKLTVRDTIRVLPLIEGGYDASITIPYAPSFTKALQKMVDKHIAPDRNFTR